MRLSDSKSSKYYTSWRQCQAYCIQLYIHQDLKGVKYRVIFILLIQFKTLQEKIDFKNHFLLYHLTGLKSHPTQLYQSHLNRIEFYLFQSYYFLLNSDISSKYPRKWMYVISPQTLIIQSRHFFPWFGKIFDI